MNAALASPAASFRNLLERLSPRQRQFAMLGAILLGGVGLLWLVFAFAESAPSGQAGKASGGTPGPVTNIGVMAPGQQVNPVDQWVGTAGSKLAQYESEREEQGRLNKDRQAFEARTWCADVLDGPDAERPSAAAGGALRSRIRMVSAGVSARRRISV